MIEKRGCIENCIYCIRVSVMCNAQVKTGLDHNNIECISLYTELMGWHCLGGES